MSVIHTFFKYGADRLLKNAKNHYNNKKYNNAKSSLETLIKKHPASDEAKEGKILLEKSISMIKRLKKEKEIAEKRRIANATKKMRRDYDKVRGITWFNDRNTTRYLDVNSFHIYLGKRKNLLPWIVLRIQYTAEDWLFIEKYIISVDGKNYTIQPAYGEVKTDNSGGKIWEWYEDVNGNKHIKMIKAIISSKETILRYNGKDFYKDRKITWSEKKALKNVLDAYEALGGKL